MGFNSSPESDDPAKKTTPQLEFAGIQSPLSIPDRSEDDWRRVSQASQKATEFPLPKLEVQSDPRAGLPPELLMLYGDPSLLPKAAKPDSKPADSSLPNFQVPTPQRAADQQPGPQQQFDATPPQFRPWQQFDPRQFAPGDNSTPRFDVPVAPAANLNVRADQAGYVTDIAYPDGKTRTIERDPVTHEAKSIITTNQEGTTRLVNQGGRWFMEVQGMQLPFPGKVEVSKDGDINMQTSADGVWRVEKPNGLITEEKENADGARASFDANHRLSKITRKDGTVIEQVNENTIVEARPGQKPVTWTNLGGLWSADNGEKPRKNLSLKDNASLTFDDANGVKHTINGRGLETLEGAGLGKITPDTSNRPSEVETADGKKIRKYEYFDEKGNDIKSVTIVDKEKGTSTVYTRDSATSKTWRSDNRGSWSGEIRVSADGVHSIRSTTRRYDDDDDNNDAGKWTSYHPDGRETSDVVGNDGSRASYDKNNVLVSYRGADGVRIDRVGDTITHYDPKIGTTVNWNKGADGNWTSDSPQFKDTRKEISFNTNGEFAYTNERGGKVQERRDGSKQIVEKDGTKLDFDNNGQIIKAVKGNLERNFIRDAQGGIVSVRDKNLTNKEERSVFDRRPPGEENRSNIHVGPNGDLSYQNPDGSAVIERSNMLHIDLDKDGDITRVVGPKSTREYQYIGEGDNKAVANIIDTRKSEKGDKVENWTRVANPDGTLSNEFRSVDDKGKQRKSRYNITPCADGEYEYRLATDKPGEKVHVERLNKEGIDGMPEGIEDARSELIAQLEGVMDKARLDQNVAFMKTFEKRMMDQTELQIAAGIDREAVLKETERQIVDTYYNCARLCVAQAPQQMYSQKDRVALAENLLYLAADPTDIKQGNQGTCWWESSWNIGVFQRNAGHGSRLIADVALTGQYTSTAGKLSGGAPKTIKVPANYVNFRNNDSGGSWTPQNARSGSHRSKVGMMMDQIGPPLYGARSWGHSNAGDHGEARNIVYMITGKDEIRHGSSGLGRHEKLQLLKTGGWTSSGGGHMWGYSMHKDKDGSWVVIKDDQYKGADHVIARIKDLRQWITGDVAADARKQWRASKPRKGETNSSYSSLASSSWGSGDGFNRTQTNDDIYGNQMKVLQMNRPKWQAQQA